MKKIFLLFLFGLTFSHYFTQIVYATSPGSSIKLIDEKKITVDLYVVELSAKNSRIESARFVWIPSHAVSQCLNKTYKACRKLYHENFRLEKGSDGTIGLKKKNAKDKLFPQYPTHVLDTLVSYNDPAQYHPKILDDTQLINILSKSNLETNKESYLILEETKIKAQIHWEQWPNGENFKILELIY